MVLVKIHITPELTRQMPLSYKQSIDDFINRTGRIPVEYVWFHQFCFRTPAGDFFTWVEAVNSLYEQKNMKPVKKSLRKMNVN